WESPDIWVRHQKDGVLHQEHQNPLGGKMNYVYVRVRNRGTGLSKTATVKLYWAKASTALSWPAPWDGSVTKPAKMGGPVGSKTSGNVPAGGSVILEYAWKAPNPADYASFGADKTHFCFLARLETGPAPLYGMAYKETSNLYNNVKNNNGIVWKNVTVLESGTGGRVGYVTVGNFGKANQTYKIRVEIPKGLVPGVDRVYRSGFNQGT